MKRRIRREKKEQKKILELRQVSVSIRDLQIVREANLTLLRDDVGVIVGPNGSGKSTLVNAVCGLYASKKYWRMDGNVVFDGDDVTSVATPELVSRGFIFVPERDHLVADFTVRENIALPASVLDLPESRIIDRTLEIFPDLKRRVAVAVGRLSVGERRMVSVGRAIALEPRLLVLDEPSEGLSNELQERLFRVMSRSREVVTGILMVEHSIEMAGEISDILYKMSDGRLTVVRDG